MKNGRSRETGTRERVLSAALAGFGRRGYDATSLDALAGDLGVRKQTILYYFPSKDVLLEAVVDEAAGEMASILTESLARPGTAWDRVEAIVRAVFRLAARRPELLGLLREITRLGPPAATRFASALGPLIDRATGFLEESMEKGELRRQDARLLLLVAYSSVVGVATEVEVLRALGVEPTARNLVRQRTALLGFLRSALLPNDPMTGRH